jgi:cell division septation protein DedD
LAQTPHPWLRDAAETILSSPDLALATSPERPEIESAFRGGAAEEPPEVEIEPTRPEAVGGLSAERFAVQVGTFQDAEAAGGLVRELQSHGFPAHVAIAAAGNGEEALHHVRIGEHCSLREADSIGVALSRALMLPYQIIEEEDPGEISPWQQPPSPVEEPRTDEPARTP